MKRGGVVAHDLLGHDVEVREGGEGLGEEATRLALAAKDADGKDVFDDVVVPVGLDAIQIVSVEQIDEVRRQRDGRLRAGVDGCVHHRRCLRLRGIRRKLRPKVS
jgi:hypothetical protein